MQLQQIVLTALVAISAVVLVNAQFSGPPPSRSQFRNDKVVRVRRPIALRQQSTFTPSITPRTIEEPKPVTESEEDEQPDVFLPQFLREQQLAQAQQAEFQQTAADFFNNAPNSIQDSPSFAPPFSLHHDEEPTPTISHPRFPERPQTVAPAPPSTRQPFNDFGIGSGISSLNSGSQRFGLERPQANVAPAPQPTQPQQQQQSHRVRSRPPAREQSRPQYEAQSAPAPAPTVRARPKPIQTRTSFDQNQLHDEQDHQHQQRRQQPVAQTLRKWREENEDGSITWGYENDDGSFKEELIGIDCITKGTYGYIDPDGNKREYHYETGNKCDPNTRQTEEDIEENGFINYEDQKAVLPNGIEIDMSQLGKKKSKRPSAIYRN